MAREVLVDRGHSVIACASGAEALTHLDEPIDVVVHGDHRDHGLDRARRLAREGREPDPCPASCMSTATTTSIGSSRCVSASAPDAHAITSDRDRRAPRAPCRGRPLVVDDENPAHDAPPTEAERAKRDARDRASPSLLSGRKLAAVLLDDRARQRDTQPRASARCEVRRPDTREHVLRHAHTVTRTSTSAPRLLLDADL